MQVDAPRRLREIRSNAHKIGRLVKENSTTVKGHYYCTESGIYEVDEIPIASIYLLPSSDEKTRKFLAKLDEEMKKILVMDWKSRTLCSSAPILEAFCLSL
jgi:hypothetical protein